MRDSNFFNVGPLLFGIEIEVHGLTIVEAGKKLQTVVPCQIEAGQQTFTKYWVSKWDGSIPQPGAEIVSPVNPSKPALQLVLMTLRNCGCYPKTKCGIHIHVSHPTEVIGMDLPVQTVWAKRAHYCGGKSNNPDRCSKYVPINKIAPNHLEVRCVNSSLNTRFVFRTIEQVLSSVIIGGTTLKSEVKVK